MLDFATSADAVQQPTAVPRISQARVTDQAKVSAWAVLQWGRLVADNPDVEP